MESLSEREQEKRVERTKRKHKITMICTVTICTIAAVLLFVYIINSFINHRYSGYKEISSVKREDSNSVQYKSYNGKILKFSRDGASGIGNDGKAIWNGSYEMNNPSADICNDYVVIGDIGGKEAYVYNGSDSGVEITEVLPITQVKIAGQGVTAVSVENGNSDEIHIYNPYASENPLLVKIPTNVSEDGYPIDFDISFDGKKLVTSYIHVKNGISANKVTFYNFDDVGKDKVNYIVGSVNMEQEICPKIEFINNETVCLYGENSFALYSMQELPEKICREDFKQDVKSIMHNKKYLGFVLENGDKEAKYRLLVYDLSGKKVSDLLLDYDYNEILFSEHEIILYSDRSVRMLRFNGQIKFDYSFDKKIDYIFPTSNKKNYLFIDENKIELIKLAGEDKE